MTIQNKRNNYVDGQFVDIDDFQTEQSYLLDRFRSDSSAFGGSGAVDLSGLQVEPDTIMVEPILSSQVAIAIDPLPPSSIAQGIPNPQNFSRFPGTQSGNTIQLYTVFNTKTTNLQRLDLRITLDQARTTEQLDLIVSIRKLIDPTNPKSPLANVPPIAEIQLAQQDIPEANSDSFIELDFSNFNSGQGVALIAGTYYATLIEFRRPSNSTSNIRVFHGPLNKNSQINSNLFSWILVGGAFVQGYLNEQNVLTQLQFYHRVYTSALKITPGTARINGNRVTIEADQFRFLEIPDRRALDPAGRLVSNYVVLQYAEAYTDVELVASTRNKVNTRIKDSAIAQVLSQPQWEAFVSKHTPEEYLLLAIVNDSNIVSIFDKYTFNVPANSTNLAFHDWLNPTNISPTEEAVNLRTARPQDFIFFVSNVPGQVPLTDAFGRIQKESTTVRDEFGNIVRRAGDPVLDDIVRVVVNISFDNGSNTRTLELAVVSEVGNNRDFRNYAATISSLSDNPFDNVFSFNLDVDQIAPNVIYNFVAFTKRGLPIYIQDYNRVISQLNPTGELLTVRNKTFQVFLDNSTLTAVINEDLQLGSFNPASDTPQPGVVQYVPALIQGEILTPVGAAQTETPRNFIPEKGGGTKILLDSESFTFEPVPMIQWSAFVSPSSSSIVKIPSTDAAVTAAYDAGDITIKVDNGDGLGPIDITFSGKTDRDKGGNGAAVLITCTIDPSVALSSDITYQAKVRNDLLLYGARDNTNYSASTAGPYGPVQVGGPSDIRTFTILARGKDTTVSPLSNAGFNDGDQVFIYIDDRQALDANNAPVSITFNSAMTTPTMPTIRALGPRRYFREKQVFSIQNTTSATPGTVLIDTGLDSSYQPRESGQVIFNESEIPTAFLTEAQETFLYSSQVAIDATGSVTGTAGAKYVTLEHAPVEISFVSSNNSTIAYTLVPDTTILALPSSVSSDVVVLYKWRGCTVYLEYAGIDTVPSDISFFKTKFRPIGTRSGFKISNTNIVSAPDEFISVPEAFALSADVNQQALDPTTFQTAALFVDGINITSLISPIGPKTIVADDGSTLQAGQVAFNPQEGIVKFFRQVDPLTGQVTSEAPSDFTRLSMAYFKLDTKFTFNTSTSASYDPRYDLNNDGHIDERDLNIFNRAYNTMLGDVNYLAAADFNSDGKVDVADLVAFRERFGTVVLGQKDYDNATTARLAALFVAKSDNYLRTLRIVKALSRAPDTTAPAGRTVLFFDESTPIADPGNYTITFGFAAALSLGFTQVEVDTPRPLLGKFNLNNIKMFETGNPLNTRMITQVATNPLPNTNNRYDSLLTFEPPVSTSSEFTIKALWSIDGISIFNRADLIIPQKYEQLDRKIYGPFKLQYTEDDFDTDGTSISFTLKATDATFADGTPDPSGTHINGIPISELTFTLHLTIPNQDGTASLWTWHNVQPSGLSNKIKLSFNEHLFIDHRIKGRNNAEVLMPFGLASTQIALKPQYAGGDLANDLANISVLRADNSSRYIAAHDHRSERSGGLLTSKSIAFTDELARLEPGSLSDIIYKLLDIIEEQDRQINLIRAIEGVVRWDRGFYWDDANLLWDSN